MRRLAQEIITDQESAECPYSKATHGNTDVVTNVITIRTVTAGA